MIPQVVSRAVKCSSGNNWAALIGRLASRQADRRTDRAQRLQTDRPNDRKTNSCKATELSARRRKGGNVASQQDGDDGWGAAVVVVVLVQLAEAGLP